jgi:hypothetical protein
MEVLEVQVVKADIWDMRLEVDWIVIPTNIGWTQDGKNVMGAGLAKQAMQRYTGLAERYGAFCRAYGERTPVVPYVRHGLVLFPVKPMAANPSYSWRQDASLELIERSARELALLAPMIDGPVGVPVVGCGNGNLSESDVIPILEAHLKGDQFLLVKFS